MLNGITYAETEIQSKTAEIQITTPHLTELLSRQFLENSPKITKLSGDIYLKARLPPSKKNFFICFNESPLKLMKNVFYINLKALFVLKIFKFLSSLFGHREKVA